jgi:NhaP-type Na+/H+ or K+/H+ antiporter
MSLPAAVMAGWGGLRGAVGLALALSMHARLGYNRDGKLIILHVSGVALLTLLVNAPTSASMLRLLGLTVRAFMARVRMIPTLSCVL